MAGLSGQATSSGPWNVPRTRLPLLPWWTTYLGDIVGVREKLEGQATDIAGVQVIDDRTVVISIDAPKAYFLAKLTHPNAYVLDRNNVEGDPSWTRACSHKAT